MALPTLTLLLDDGTGTFPTNISSRVLTDGYQISRGRADWQGAVTAGEMSVTLNNSDGFFTVGAGAVFVDQQMRLSETVNGVTYTRFTGYVKSWPTSWPAVVVTFSTVAPTATDAQARAERTTLRSMLEEEILANSPSAYYTLGEATGSTTAGDTSGNQMTPMAFVGTGTAPTFGTGTGPGVDALTAVQVSPDGQFLEGVAPTGFVGIGAAFSMSAFIADGDPTGVQPTQVVLRNKPALNLSGNVPMAVMQWQRGSVTFQGFGESPFVTAAASDTATHHLALTFDGAVTYRFYVDGALVGTDATGASFTVTATTLDVQRSLGSGTAKLGTVSHVAVFPSRLTDAQVAAIASLGTTAFAESGTARITRLAGYANIPVGTLDASQTNVGAQATSGASAFSAIQDVTDAEGGLTFINGSGNLTFHNRARPSAKATPDLTLTSAQVTPDVQPVIDDQYLVNYFETTTTGTGATQFVSNAASLTLHGRYPESKSYLVLTDQEALDRANWALSKLATPVERYGTLTVNLYAMTASQASTVLAALDLNCWLRVTSMASQTPGGTTADVVVEGWQEQVTAESWSVTCNVVDRSLFTAGLLNDATYGLLNSMILGL